MAQFIFYCYPYGGGGSRIGRIAIKLIQRARPIQIRRVSNCPSLFQDDEIRHKSVDLRRSYPNSIIVFERVNAINNRERERLLKCLGSTRLGP